MNIILISKHLHVLRKEHGYTQEKLAEELHISRQAVSKWEQAETIPDIATLLQLSKLYQMTINDILEPQIVPGKIEDFEEIIKIPRAELAACLNGFTMEEIALALMGASPMVNEFIASLYPEEDLVALQRKLGRVKAADVETAQKQIVAMINLLSSTFSSE